MAVPVVDFELQAGNMLPFAQRLPYWLIFVRSLINPIVRLYSLLLSFMNGSVDLGYWSSVITYAKGDRVRSINGVYESLVDGNLNNAVTNELYWTKVLGYFIGANERVVYNGRKINFEWALNRYFNTTFRQPDDPVTPTPSDIYIANISINDTSFITGSNSPSSVYSYTSSGYVFGTEVYGFASSYEFYIYIPLTIYNALGITDAIRESIVRGFADKYVAVGTFYTIQTY